MIGGVRPSTGAVAATPPVSDDEHLVALLRGGDESAFFQLVEAHHATMLRLAMGYVHDRQVAEEVVQEAWLGVLRGLDRFEARSSLRTWMFHILANSARTRAVRERRSTPLSALRDPPPSPSSLPSRASAFCRQMRRGGLGTGRPFHKVGVMRLRSVSSRGRRRARSEPRSMRYRRASARWCPYGISMAAQPRKCVALCRFPRPITACCCTVAGRACRARLSCSVR